MYLAEHVAPPMSVPMRPLTPSQPTRVIGKTPSLKDIRTLLARRNVSSPSTRPTPTPTQTSNEDGESRTPAESVAAPATKTKTNRNARAGSSEERTSHKGGAWRTSTPATVSAPGSEATSARARRRRVPFVPFEAFISPMRSWSKNASDKGTRVDEDIRDVNGRISPTASRSRTMSTGMLGSRVLKGKERESRHVRRESAAAAFEAYIVRNSPRREQTRMGRRADMDGDEEVDADADAGAGMGHNLQSVESLAVKSLETKKSERVEPVVSEAVSVGVLDDGGDEVGDAVEAPVDSTRVDDGETDETDALLELASVHLSQPTTNVEAEAQGVEVPELVVNEVEMMDEVRCAYILFVDVADGFGVVAESE